MAEFPCAWVRRRRNPAAGTGFRANICPHLRAFPLENLQKNTVNLSKNTVNLSKLLFVLSAFFTSPERTTAAVDPRLRSSKNRGPSDDLSGMSIVV
ncbi:MAG: hypothetical protein OXG62_04865 [Nitrospinae bacterium]|nr:hypothetical protein [Nitrospinota bacterium]